MLTDAVREEAVDYDAPDYLQQELFKRIIKRIRKLFPHDVKKDFDRNDPQHPCLTLHAYHGQNSCWMVF